MSAATVVGAAGCALQQQDPPSPANTQVVQLKTSSMENLVTGDHQFSMVADTNHINAAAFTTYLIDNLPVMQAHNIKHIMLEQPPYPIQDIVKPAIEDRLEYLKASYLTVYLAKAVVKGYSKNESASIASIQSDFQDIDTFANSPDFKESKFSEEAKEEFEKLRLASKIISDQINKLAAEKNIDPDNLDTAETLVNIRETLAAEEIALENAIRVENFLREPSLETAELLPEDNYLASAWYRDEEDRTQQHESFVKLIIKAHQHGIKVHFTDDGVGSDELQQWLDFSKNLTTNEDETDIALEEEHFQKLMEETDEKFSAFLRVRLDAQHEEARALRMIELAQGERALGFWGNEHFNKMLDINEFLDRHLRARAEANDEPFSPTKVMGLYLDRNEYEQSASRRDKPDYDRPDYVHVLRL